MAFLGASTSLLPALQQVSNVASTSRRLLSTTASLWGKSPPGKGRNALLKARRLKREGDPAKKSPVNLDRVIPTLNLEDAVRLFSAVEVARPGNAYEIQVETKVSSHTVNALRGRMALPTDPRTRAEKLLIFTEDGSDSIALLQSMMEQDASLKNNVTYGGAELITAVANGTGIGARVQYTKVLCSSNLLPQLSRMMARDLGPRGLMPSPKRGTVFSSADDLRQAMYELQSAIDWRGDRQGVVRCAIGRIHYTQEQLQKNITTLLHGIVDKINNDLSGDNASATTNTLVVPDSRIGKLNANDTKRAVSLIKQLFLSSSQGPSVKLNPAELV